MSTNKAAAGNVSVSPEARSLSTRCSRRPCPPPSRTWVFKRTWMFSVASISSTRYWDMWAVRDSPSTSRVTRLACLERCRAACPAEFPPPTTQTSWPFMPCAWATAAP
jgi:hypothetical protein